MGKTEITTDLEKEIERDDPKILVFKKPFVFEEKTYHELDLSKLEDITGADLIRTQKIYESMAGRVSLSPEITIEYAMALSSEALNLPVEFFKALPAKEVLILKRKIVGFLF